MKILITGGAGFIGSHSCDTILENGHDVIVVDDLSQGKQTNISRHAKFYKVDICDKKGLEDVFSSVKPDMVLHHAAQISVRKSIINPAEDARINIMGGLNVLDCCVKFKVKKLVYSGSCASYGEPVSLPVKEKNPTRPLSPYGLSKLCFERYIELYSEIFGLEYTILRYANVYGPRQDPQGEAGVISIFCEGMLAKKKLKIYGDGGQTRDFVYVGDIASANLLALTKKSKNKIFNVGMNEPLSINMLFDKIKKITGYALDASYDKPIEGEIRDIYLDNSLMIEELGWKPKTDIDSGLKKTIEWMRSRKA